MTNTLIVIKTTQRNKKVNNRLMIIVQDAFWIMNTYRNAYIKCISKKSVIYVKLMTWHSRLKKHKAFKRDISKELIPLTQHPMRWWNWGMPENDKKEIEPILIDEIGR